MEPLEAKELGVRTNKLLHVRETSLGSRALNSLGIKPLLGWISEELRDFSVFPPLFSSLLWGWEVPVLLPVSLSHPGARYPGSRVPYPGSWARDGSQGNMDGVENPDSLCCILPLFPTLIIPEGAFQRKSQLCDALTFPVMP